MSLRQLQSNICEVCQGYGYIVPCVRPDRKPWDLRGSTEVCEQLRQKPIKCPLCSGESDAVLMARSRKEAMPEPPAAPPQPLQAAPANPYPAGYPQYQQPQPAAVPQPAMQAPMAPPVAPQPQYAPPVAQPISAPPEAPQQPFVQEAPSQQPAPQYYSATPYGNSPLHMLDMEGEGDFQLLPDGTEAEGEILTAVDNQGVKVSPVLEQAKSGSGNYVLKFQISITYPAQYARIKLFENIAICREMAWKYKSLCRVCEDENGKPLLSADGRFFQGRGPEDFTGNIVAFKTRQGMTNQGRAVNQVDGQYYLATKTEGMIPVAPTGNGPTPAGTPQLVTGPPDAANIKW